jgi:hypothetical protein
VAVVGVFAISMGLRAAVRRGPLRAARAWHPTTSTRAWTCGLLAYALLGDGLLAAGIEGGPTGPPTGGSDSPWPIALASLLALTLAVVPAAWCAHLFAVRARRRLATSRGLEEFASSVRPLLLGVFGLFLCALGGLLAGSGAWLGEPPAYAAAGALGALLLLARLLTVHGFTHAPAVILAAAGTAEALALVSVFAGRLGAGIRPRPRVRGRGTRPPDPRDQDPHPGLGPRGTRRHTVNRPRRPASVPSALPAGPTPRAFRTTHGNTLKENAR